jgi:hypothetical protein
MIDLPETLKAFSAAAADVVARTIEDVRKEASRMDEMRALEHRAFMAEQREIIEGMKRDLAEKIATVKDGKDGRDGIDGKDGADGLNGIDGRDGTDGKDADMEAIGKQIDDRFAAIPIPKDGKDGADGKDGLNGADGRDGLDAYPGEARGLYDTEAEYRARDIVMLNGSSFMAKADSPGECPGDGWMLLAQRGKSGKPGDRGERGIEGKSGKDGAQIIALHLDDKDMKFIAVMDDGNQLEADFYPIAKAIRGDAT